MAGEPGSVPAAAQSSCVQNVGRTRAHSNLQAPARSFLEPASRAELGVENERWRASDRPWRAAHKSWHGTRTLKREGEEERKRKPKRERENSKLRREEDQKQKKIETERERELERARESDVLLLHLHVQSGN